VETVTDGVTDCVADEVVNPVPDSVTVGVTVTVTVGVTETLEDGVSVDVKVTMGVVETLQDDEAETDPEELEVTVNVGNTEKLGDDDPEAETVPNAVDDDIGEALLVLEALDDTVLAGEAPLVTVNALNKSIAQNNKLIHIVPKMRERAKNKCYNIEENRNLIIFTRSFRIL